MAIGVLGAMAIGGTALSILGNYQANKAQAAAERQNAQFLREQMEFYQRTADRDVRLLERETDKIKGEQIANAGASGLAMTGSVLTLLMSTHQESALERIALEDNADMAIREAGMKAGQAEKTADTLSSTSFNLTQAGSKLLSVAPSFA